MLKKGDHPASLLETGLIQLYERRIATMLVSSQYGAILVIFNRGGEK
jgi:hypothetical protein